MDYVRDDKQVTSRVLAIIPNRGMYVEARWPVGANGREYARRCMLPFDYFTNRYGVRVKDAKVSASKYGLDTAHGAL